MRSLPELQAEFVRAVLGRADPATMTWLDAAQGDAARRLWVYRTNARENFHTALAAAFPLLRRLLGDTEFAQLAFAYQRECPSRAGNLFHVGEQLAAFLDLHVTGTADDCLRDVACLEWAVQEIMVAADTTDALDLDALRVVPSDQHGALRFHMQPAMRMLVTRYALFDWWQAQQRGSALPAGSRPAPGLEYLLLRRAAAGGIVLHRLPEAEYRFLAALRDGSPLETALASAAGSDVAAILGRWAQSGVIAGFSL
jgi:hypothetical protein